MPHTVAKPSSQAFSTKCTISLRQLREDDHKKACLYANSEFRHIESDTKVIRCIYIYITYMYSINIGHIYIR